MIHTHARTERQRQRQRQRHREPEIHTRDRVSRSGAGTCDGCICPRTSEDNARSSEKSLVVLHQRSKTRATAASMSCLFSRNLARFSVCSSSGPVYRINSNLRNSVGVAKARNVRMTSSMNCGSIQPKHAQQQYHSCSNQCARSNVALQQYIPVVGKVSC
jgi:hypothetical protein